MHFLARSTIEGIGEASSSSSVHFSVLHPVEIPLAAPTTKNRRKLSQSFAPTALDKAPPSTSPRRSTPRSSISSPPATASRLCACLKGPLQRIPPRRRYSALQQLWPVC